MSITESSSKTVYRTTYLTYKTYECWLNDWYWHVTEISQSVLISLKKSQARNTAAAQDSAHHKFCKSYARWLSRSTEDWDGNIDTLYSLQFSNTDRLTRTNAGQRLSMPSYRLARREQYKLVNGSANAETSLDIILYYVHCLVMITHNLMTKRRYNLYSSKNRALATNLENKHFVNVLTSTNRWLFNLYIVLFYSFYNLFLTECSRITLNYSTFPLKTAM